MLAPILTWTTMVGCLVCAAANAFFYLADPNDPPAPDGWTWITVLTLAVVYGLFALLAWSQRRDWPGAAVVLSAFLLSAALLLFGRGRDWYGSVTVPNYYNQVIRLGSAFGGVGQMLCLLLAGVGVLVIRLPGWLGFNRRLAP
jgi:hypothetical protein